jgi:hypothetical protein
MAGPCGRGDGIAPSRRSVRPRSPVCRNVPALRNVLLLVGPAAERGGGDTRGPRCASGADASLLPAPWSACLVAARAPLRVPAPTAPQPRQWWGPTISGSGPHSGSSTPSAQRPSSRPTSGPNSPPRSADSRPNAGPAQSTGPLVAAATAVDAVATSNSGPSNDPNRPELPPHA